MFNGANEIVRRPNMHSVKDVDVRILPWNAQIDSCISVYEVLQVTSNKLHKNYIVRTACLSFRLKQSGDYWKLL
jgi:hypothetical protein